jgi:hypothetical protein
MDLNFDFQLSKPTLQFSYPAWLAISRRDKSFATSRAYRLLPSAMSAALCSSARTLAPARSSFRSCALRNLTAPQRGDNQIIRFYNRAEVKSGVYGLADTIVYDEAKAIADSYRDGFGSARRKLVIYFDANFIEPGFGAFGSAIKTYFRRRRWGARQLSGKRQRRTERRA